MRSNHSELIKVFHVQESLIIIFTCVSLILLVLAFNFLW